MKKEHIQHLYNRIGFGITPKESQKIFGKPRKEIIDFIFESSKNTIPLKLGLSYDPIKLRNEDLNTFFKKNGITIKNYNTLWIKRLCNTKQLLREKMTLFWANHFVCSGKDRYIFTENNAIQR